MRDFICTDRAENFAPALLMVCLPADGDVTERELMEAILFLAKPWRFVCLRGCRQAEGQRNDPSVNSKRTRCGRSNTGGFGTALSRPPFVRLKHEPLCIYKVSWRSPRFSHQSATSSLGDISPRSGAPTSDDHAALAFRGSKPRAGMVK